MISDSFHFPPYFLTIGYNPPSKLRNLALLIPLFTILVQAGLLLIAVKGEIPTLSY
jgi:hypothetical protein